MLWTNECGSDKTDVVRILTEGGGLSQVYGSLPYFHPAVSVIVLAIAITRRSTLSFVNTKVDMRLQSIGPNICQMLQLLF